MTVLAIETATAVCGAAVIRGGGGVMGEARVESPHVHSEQLISLVDAALRGAGLESGGIDGIAVSVGPGSFTGLRIGLSVAKGLAYAWNKPLVPVFTLEALAMAAVQQSLAVSGSLIVATIDARRAEVYAAVYRRVNDALEEVVSSRAVQIRDLASIVPAEAPVIVMGDGADKFHEFLEQGGSSTSSRFVIPSRDRRLCSAVAVGLLGERALASGQTADIASVEPLYVKDFQSLVRTAQLEVQS